MHATSRSLLISVVLIATSASAWLGSACSGDAGPSAASADAGDARALGTFGDRGAPPWAPQQVRATVPPELVVSTLAGSGTAGLADGNGSAASFDGPTDVTVDAHGFAYVADLGNKRVRKIAPDGAVTTLASPDGGTLVGAQALAVDDAGNLYIADERDIIVEITPAGVVTTLAGTGVRGYADGPARTAMFGAPCDIALDAAGTLYVAECLNRRIRKIATDGTVSTLAGSGASGEINGPGWVASFNVPAGIALDPAGSLYVADSFNHRIRKVSRAGDVSTFAGVGIAGYADGFGTGSAFDRPTGVVVGPTGDVYVADTNNGVVRRISTEGAVTTFAGSRALRSEDGPVQTASFYRPAGIAFDRKGDLYIVAPAENRIRKIGPRPGEIAVSWGWQDTAAGPVGATYRATATAAGQPERWCTSTGIGCTVTKLASGVPYRIIVTGTNLIGTSPPSDAVEATPR